VVRERAKNALSFFVYVHGTCALHYWCDTVPTPNRCQYARVFGCEAGVTNFYTSNTFRPTPPCIYLYSKPYSNSMNINFFLSNKSTFIRPVYTYLLEYILRVSLFSRSHVRKVVLFHQFTIKINKLIKTSWYPSSTS